MPLFCEKAFKVKQQLKAASNALLESELIPPFASFEFYTNHAGVEMMRFERTDSRQTDMFAPDASKDTAETNFQIITDLCKDKQSYPFYHKVAANMSTDDILRAVGETKAFLAEARRKGASGSEPKVFTSRILSLAQERGVELRN
jgi:hypothetical protein